MQNSNLHMSNPSCSIVGGVALTSQFAFLQIELVKLLVLFSMVSSGFSQTTLSGYASNDTTTNTVVPFRSYTGLTLIISSSSDYTSRNIQSLQATRSFHLMMKSREINKNLQRCKFEFPISLGQRGRSRPLQEEGRYG
jgi:hypothetical protein